MEPLTEQEIRKYYDGEISTENGVASIIYTNQRNNAYNKSIVKSIVNNWARDEFSTNLVTDDNSKYASKILSTEDLVQYLGFEWGAVDADATSFTYLSSNLTPGWFSDITYNLWLMTPYEDSTNQNWVVSKGKSTVNNNVLYLKNAILPVVNVDKCAINPNGAGCKKCTYAGSKINFLNYKEYSVGNIVTYKGVEYYVVKNSSKLLPYVTLLKKEPLTADEVNTYGKLNNESIVNKYIYYNENNSTGRFDRYYSSNSSKYKTGTCIKDYVFHYCDDEFISTTVHYYSYVTAVPGQAYEYGLGYGGMLYYTDSSCGSFNGTDVIDRDKNACLKYSNYDLSNIKIVVDNWKNSNLVDSDLVEIDGYKVRLLKYSEYHDIEYNSNIDYLTKWFNPNEYSYWLMDAYDTKIRDLTYYGEYLSESPTSYSIVYPTVRPVINVSKCALDDGCFDETFNLATCTLPSEDESDEPSNQSDPDNPKNPEDNPSIIDVDNTLKFISKISLFLSFILVSVGIGIFGYNYYSSKKIRKNIEK